MHIFSSYWANLWRYLWQWHLNNWDTCLCCFWHHSSHGKVCNLFIFRHEIQPLDEAYVILALQARGCWKWQGSILDPSSKTMDRLSGKWEEDSTNCWTRMEENGTIWQGIKHNPTPTVQATPCYYIRGDSAFGYCTKIRLVRLGYCFTPYQRLRLHNGAP